MAPDEALLELRREGRSPDTLRLYVFKLSAVTIGYFQMEMGVEVALFAFTPIGGTPMERCPRPGLERYRAVQLIRYRLSRGRDPGILDSRGGEGAYARGTLAGECARGHLDQRMPRLQ